MMKQFVLYREESRFDEGFAFVPGYERTFHPCVAIDADSRVVVETRHQKANEFNGFVNGRVGLLTVGTCSPTT